MRVKYTCCPSHDRADAVRTLVRLAQHRPTPAGTSRARISVRPVPQLAGALGRNPGSATSTERAPSPSSATALTSRGHLSQSHDKDVGCLAIEETHGSP